MKNRAPNFLKWFLCIDLFFGPLSAINADNNKKLAGTRWEAYWARWYETKASTDFFENSIGCFFEFYDGDSCKMFDKKNNCIGKGFYGEYQIYFNDEDFKKAFDNGAYYFFREDKLVIVQNTIPAGELWLTPSKKPFSSKEALTKSIHNTKKTIEKIFKTNKGFDLPSVVDKNIKTRINAGLGAYGRGFLVMPQASLEAEDGKVYAINIKSGFSKLKGNKIITPMYLRQISPTTEYKCYYYTLTIDVNGNFISLERDSVGKW